MFSDTLLLDLLRDGMTGLREIFRDLYVRPGDKLGLLQVLLNKVRLCAREFSLPTLVQNPVRCRGLPIGI